MSPDGSKALFICDWNLWVRDVATGQETPAHDRRREGLRLRDRQCGLGDAATAPSCSGRRTAKKIATQQQDERKVGDMYLVETPVNGGHPVLRAWKYPLPGDPVVAMIQPRRHRRRHRQDRRACRRRPTSTARCRRQHRHGRLPLEPRRLEARLVSTDRAIHKNAVAKRRRRRDRRSPHALRPKGSRRTFETRVQWQILWPTNEVLWYSQRDDWRQLYLYDLNTGQLKNKITTGDGPVTRDRPLDRADRTIWYAADGKEKGQDPYFTHFYRIGLDGRNNVSLTPDNGTHAVQLSPDGKYLVDTFSQPDVAPETTLRDGATGKLDHAAREGRHLEAAGDRLEAADADQDEGRRRQDGYLRHALPADELRSDARNIRSSTTRIRGRSRAASARAPSRAARGDKQALAELGFVVVSIDGTRHAESVEGVPRRLLRRDGPRQHHPGSDRRHEGAREAVSRGSTSTRRRCGAIRAAASSPPTRCSARRNDFFKVGIAESGNHDQRQYEDDWGERYQGPLVKNADGTDNYDDRGEPDARPPDLKGHLLLMHGTMDNNVPPYNTLLVADALIKANKDFDCCSSRTSRTATRRRNYVMRRRWDYFVKYLLDAEPPRDYVIPSAPAGGGRGGRGSGAAAGRR